MERLLPVSCLLVGSVLLSACGGGSTAELLETLKANNAAAARAAASNSTSSSGGSSSGQGPLQDALEEAESLLAFVNPLGVTPTADLPMSGSATYDGFIAFSGVGVDESFIGDLSLDVNFANNSISGSATDFLDNSENAYTGTLVVDGGAIDRSADPQTDVQFDADIGGTLADGGASRTIDGELKGYFVGSNQSAVVGSVSGTVGGGASGTATIDEDNSGFIARR